jgi:hypothetical protein
LISDAAQRRDTETAVYRRRGPRLIRIAIVVVVAVIAAGATVWAIGGDWRGDPLDPGTPLPASTQLSASDRTFYDALAPKFRSIATESQELSKLGKEKSRNLIELERRSNRVDSIAAEVNAYLATHPTPAIFAKPVQRYRAGVAAVQQGISQSRAAFTTFNWSEVAKAVEIGARGADNLSIAVQEFEIAAGEPLSASPIATP